MLHSHPLRIAVLFVGTLLLASPAYAGGGGWLIKPLGLMLGGAMLITLVLSKIQQTSILSFIAMGVVMGLAIGGYEEDYLLAHFPGLDAIVSGFQQVGIALLLFIAGMEFDIGSITKRARLVLTNGIGQIVRRDAGLGCVCTTKREIACDAGRALGDVCGEAGTKLLAEVSVSPGHLPL